MKKMLLFILVIGLALSGYLVKHRQPPKASTPDKLAPVGHAPVNEWQETITLDLRTDYSGTDPAQRKLIETLRQEEQRQRPQEGRN